MSIHTDTGIFQGEIMLYVNDTRHLEQLIERLKGRGRCGKGKSF